MRTAISLKTELAALLKQEAKAKGLRVSEYVEMLHNFYELEHVDLLITQIKLKYKTGQLSLNQRASLEVLKIYLDNIFD